MKLSRLARDWGVAETGPLQAELERLGGRSAVVDLVSCTPSETGLYFPPDVLRALVEDALAAPRLTGYAPDPRGWLGAREAVAEYHGAISPEHVLLTPGTSLGYLMAFTLLADRGGEILIPNPGYPLFEELAAMAGVTLRSYYLQEKEGGEWSFDPEEVAFQITARTRAVVVVSPHNPTGHQVSAEEYEALAEICRQRGIALIVDEVFREFAPPMPRPSGGAFPLLLTLNGISKMLSLPQWKGAWVAVDGNERLVREFTTAAERFLDALLPVSELVQLLLPGLLAEGECSVIGELRNELAARHGILREALGLAPRPASGVYVCPRLPASASSEAVALEALRDHRLLLHPGYFYDLKSHVVLTCVARPDDLRGAVALRHSFNLGG
jgi:aspartate/methionine/tyrosine aminotransferase